MKLDLIERETQQEPHFRKFEPWIAKACKGTVVMDPQVDAPEPVKQSSLALYLREAILSHRRNHWNSPSIPVGYDLKHLQVKQTKDGKVVILNEYQDHQNSLVKPEDIKTVLIKDGKVAAILQKQKCPVAEAALSTIEGLDEGTINGWETIYLVKPSDVEEFMKIYPNRNGRWEQLAEGWWRVM